MDGKTNMKQFVEFISLAIIVMAVCITAAHAWNFPEHPFITCAAVIAIVGSVINAVRLGKKINDKFHEE